jgi:hypothetical protein
LDGNFCDEFYKYILDILQNTKRIQLQQSSGNIYEQTEGDYEKSKFTFDDLKKPYFKKDSAMPKRVLFEQFYIHEIKLNFTFQSSPILFREFTMNPTLKFLIMLLSNLKNVHLRFGKYQPWSLHQQVLLPIFLQQLKKNYASQVYNNQSLLRLVGSMGLLGNMNEKVSNLKYAC